MSFFFYYTEFLLINADKKIDVEYHHCATPNDTLTGNDRQWLLTPFDEMLMANLMMAQLTTAEPSDQY